MKNLEQLERLWRDDPKHVFIYAMCLWLVLSFAYYHVRIKNQRIERDALILNLSPPEPTRIIKQADTVLNPSCVWKQSSQTWEIQGSFAFVYDCLFHGVPNNLPVSAMVLQQHVLGVHATLTLRERAL